MKEKKITRNLKKRTRMTNGFVTYSWTPTRLIIENKVLRAENNEIRWGI